MKKLGIIILSMLLFNGCLSTKKISKKETVTKEKLITEVKKDSVSIIKTNQEIKDRIVINVPESDNKEVMKMFDVLLRQMNTSKSSGSNSYSSTYDEDTRQLVIDFIIGQTENKETNMSSDVKIEKSFEEKTDEYLYKKITTLPWWAYLVAAYFLRSHIIGFLSFFFPQIRAIKSFTGLKRKLK